MLSQIVGCHARRVLTAQPQQWDRREYAEQHEQVGLDPQGPLLAQRPRHTGSSRHSHNQIHYREDRGISYSTLTDDIQCAGLSATLTVGNSVWGRNMGRGLRVCWPGLTRAPGAARPIQDRPRHLGVAELTRYWFALDA